MDHVSWLNASLGRLAGQDTIGARAAAEQSVINGLHLLGHAKRCVTSHWPELQSTRRIISLAVYFLAARFLSITS